MTNLMSLVSKHIESKDAIKDVIQSEFKRLVAEITSTDINEWDFSVTQLVGFEFGIFEADLINNSAENKISFVFIPVNTEGKTEIRLKMSSVLKGRKSYAKMNDFTKEEYEFAYKRLYDFVYGNSIVFDMHTLPDVLKTVYGVFTVATIEDDTHKVELHYDSHCKKAWINYFELVPDKSDTEENQNVYTCNKFDAPWFTTDLSEEQIQNNLYNTLMYNSYISNIKG